MNTANIAVATDSDPGPDLAQASKTFLAIALPDTYTTKGLDLGGGIVVVDPSAGKNLKEDPNGIITKWANILYGHNYRPGVDVIAQIAYGDAYARLLLPLAALSITSPNERDVRPMQVAVWNHNDWAFQFEQLEV